MKECQNCEYFEGWDHSDGTPHCTYEENGCSGYEYCPYNEQANIKNNGMKIEIDAGFMRDYILHTIKNTIEGQAYLVAVNEVKSVVTDEIKHNVVEELKNQSKNIIEKQLEEFMSGDIVVGGGWSEPERKLTRQQYLSELIEKELERRFKNDAIKDYAEREAKGAIDSFTRRLKDEINAGVKMHFNEATRQVLTENVVSMLMCNDTYKKLSNSMQSFLPNNKD